MVALYAMKYSSMEQQLLAKDVLRAENNRSDAGNGVEFVLKAHQQLEADALERLFNNNPLHMIHGYVPDITNPHTDVQTVNAEQGKDLVAQGYELVGKVSKDPTDPDAEPKFTYVRKGGGLTRYLSGAMSLTDLAHKGTTVHNGYLNTNTQVGLKNAQTNAAIWNQKVSRMRQIRDSSRDMSQGKGGQMVPLLDENGENVNWRYMMSAKTKDTLLERDNRFEQVLGTLAGSVFDKESSVKQNTNVIAALREHYEADYGKNPNSYVFIGPKSEDAHLQEIWNMLPEATKQQVRKTWGQDGMWVGKDAVDILFGYRKFSLNDMFQKKPEARRKYEEFVVHFFDLFFKSCGYSDAKRKNLIKRVGWRIARGERAWQEVVRETKDIIVVKSGLVTLGNILSNMSLLMAKGVPFTSILHHHKVIIGAVMAYQKDSKRLADLKTLLKLGHTQGKAQAIQDEIVELKDAIARNPAKKLIDEGLLPSIVEDVAADDDIYSYKSELGEKMEKYTDKIPTALKTIGKTLYMAEDTWMYQSFSKMAQLSDFVARYTLYQHLTEKANNPLSHAEAVKEASDAFVNYDVPMHKSLQWTDDMGFTMFTKYFLRIQRVLMKTFKEHPLRVLMMASLNHYVNLGPIVLDSSFIHHMGNNPFNLGALQYLSVWDELPVVGSAMKLVK